jgi:uncharacterized protein (TIGR00369 family)
MVGFVAANTNFDEVVRDSFARQPFMALVGAKMTALKPGYCELTAGRAPELTQQHGFFHGGLVVSVADSAAGYAAYSLFPENSTVLTVDLKTSFLNPASGDQLIAVAEVVGNSGQLYHLKADVFTFVDDKKIHCLTGLFTMMCLIGRSDAIEPQARGS